MLSVDWGGSPVTCGPGCPCGTDRIGYFTDFAVPIDGCCVVTLVIGVTGNIDFSFNWLKESQECELVSPSKFLCCAASAICCDSGICCASG